ncbi:MAG TPA: substrate-binding domain-containing protein [Vicinamibacteria bacterium]|jgi:ribose transport system substrate-binding protein
MADKVVISLPDRVNEFQQLQAVDARETAARLGLAVELVFAENNAVLQIQQLFKVVHAEGRPRAILVEPVALEGMERLARRAADAGVGTAFLNCVVADVDRLRADFPALPIFAVGSDQAEIGRLQARQIRALLPAGGTVLYVQGPTANPVVEVRHHATEEVLAGSGVRLVVIDAHWTEESAEKAVRSWLRLKTSAGVAIDLVAGQDDAIARGARSAFEATPEGAARARGVPFLGIDGVPSVGQRHVLTGQLAATVVMPSNTGPALQALAAYLRTGALPPAQHRVPVHSFPPEAELKPRA